MNIKNLNIKNCIATAIVVMGSVNAVASDRVVTGSADTYDGKAAACKSAKDDAASNKKYEERVVGFSQCDCDKKTSGDHTGLWTCTVDAKLEKRR